MQFGEDVNEVLDFASSELSSHGFSFDMEFADMRNALIRAAVLLNIYGDVRFKQVEYNYWSLRKKAAFTLLRTACREFLRRHMKTLHDEASTDTSTFISGLHACNILEMRAFQVGYQLTCIKHHREPLSVTAYTCDCSQLSGSMLRGELAASPHVPCCC